jgi:O-Antigen ligase
MSDGKHQAGRRRLPADPATTVVERARRQPHDLLDTLVSLLVVLAIFGYPLAASLPIFLSTDTQLFSVPYRALVVGLTLLALLLWALERRRIVLPMQVQMLLAIAVLVLSLRFVHDAFALGLPPHPVQSKEGFALFFYGVTLAPALALAIPLSDAALGRLHRTLLRVGVTTAVLVVLAIAFWVPDLEATARAEGEGLNAITYATVGAVLILLAWSRPARRGASTRQTLMRVGLVVLGFVPLVTSASRGPIIAVLATLAVDGIVSSRAPRWRTALMIFAAAAALFVVGSEWAGSLGDAEDAIAIAKRLSDVSEDQSTLERLVILNSSWEVFAASPWWGGAMVEPLLRAYPHNIVLEALMVGGLPFGLLTTWLLVAAGVRAVRLMAAGPAAAALRFIGMFTLFTLTMSMLSGSLYRGPELWAVLVLCFACRLPASSRTARLTRSPRPTPFPPAPGTGSITNR